MAGRLGGARNVACALWIVDEQVELAAARQTLEPDLRPGPAERAADTTQVEDGARGMAKAYQVERLVAHAAPMRGRARA